jgi:hypothetical protein
MGRRRRDLLKVMRGDDRGGRGRRRGRGLERFDQCLSRRQIEPRGGFVEDQELRVGEEGASEEHPLSLPLAGGGESPRGEVSAAHALEQRRRAALVGLVEHLEPRRQGRAFSGQHHGQDREVR